MKEALEEAIIVALAEEKTNPAKECNVSKPEIPNITSDNNDDKERETDTNDGTQIKKN